MRDLENKKQWVDDIEKTKGRRITLVELIKWKADEPFWDLVKCAKGSTLRKSSTSLPVFYDGRAQDLLW